LTVENDSLFYVYPAGNRAKLLPFAKDRFFMKNNFNEFVFERNTHSEIVFLTVNGTGYTPMKLDKTDKPLEVKKEVELPDELLDKYQGKYELMPDFFLTVTREGKRVFVQGTGQNPIEVFATEPHRFFAKMINAEIIFHQDESGMVTGLTLLQNGEHKAKKL
jgi:hypothetical protein